MPSRPPKPTIAWEELWASTDFRPVARLTAADRMLIVNSREVGNALEIWVQDEDKDGNIRGSEMQRFTNPNELSGYLITLRLRYESSGWAWTDLR